MCDPSDVRIAELREFIAMLETKLVEAREAVQSWVDASSVVSHRAAVERAKNQGAGRDLLGLLLGAKYRRAERASAAASNARIALDVAVDRACFAAGKREAQAVVRRIKADLAASKAELRTLLADAKVRMRGRDQIEDSSAASKVVVHQRASDQDARAAADAVERGDYLAVLPRAEAMLKNPAAANLDEVTRLLDKLNWKEDQIPHPERAKLFRFRGDVAEARGQLELARSWWEESYKLDPKVGVKQKLARLEGSR